MIAWWVSWTPLGWPGRARRVDQRDDVLGADLRRSPRRRRSPGSSPRRPPARACPRAPRRRSTITCSSAGQVLARLEDHRQERLLDDRHARAGVGAQELDLRRRIGDVDRERRRAERHRCQVGDVELGAVAEHDRDRVAAARRRARQAAGERVDAAQQLRPGQRDVVVGRAHGDEHRGGWRPCGGAPRSRSVRRPRAPPPGSSCCFPSSSALVVLIRLPRKLSQCRVKASCRAKLSGR